MLTLKQDTAYVKYLIWLSKVYILLSLIMIKRYSKILNETLSVTGYAITPYAIKIFIIV